MSELDQQQKCVMKWLEHFPPTHTLAPKVARPIFKALDYCIGIKKVKIKQIVNMLIPSRNPNRKIPIRIYYPDSTKDSENPHAMMYFHGGGCVIGSIQTHDRLCRHLAQHTNTAIISVEYRLAPEHKFPAGILDAVDAWNWLTVNKGALGLSNHTLGTGGDSAGAYLSLLLGLISSNELNSATVNQRPQFQYLLYPMVDLRGTSQSYQNAISGMLLTKDLMDYFQAHYLEDSSQVNLPLVSPTLFDNLINLPKTYLLTVEFDPLRDTGMAFVEKLKAQSVAVTHQHFDDCMHGFISTTKVSKRAKQGLDEITKQLTHLCST